MRQDEVLEDLFVHVVAERLDAVTEVLVLGDVALEFLIVYLREEGGILDNEISKLLDEGGE